MDLKQFFLLDWCPYGTSRADLTETLNVRKLDHSTLQRLLDEIEKCTGHRSTNLVFAARGDGLLIFSFDVPTTYRRYDVRDAAHTLSFELKSLLFEHTHHHHSKQKRGIGIHPPIAFHSNEFDEVDYGTASERKQYTQEVIEKILMDDREIYELRPISWGGQVDQSGRAVMLLDRFIARRYDDCIEDISSNKKQLRSDRPKRNLKLLATFSLSFFALHSLNNYLHQTDTSPKQVVIIFLISSFISLLLWLYMSYKNNYRYTLHMLNSYIGFFERAGDFSEVANSICERCEKSRKSESGYRNLIGSLCVIKEDVQRKVATEESVVTGALTALGLMLALVALIDF